jgi:hypothetical protein
LAWLAMMCDECMLGVVTFACLVFRVRGVMAFGWRVLLRANLVVVIFCLRFVAAAFLRRWPTLVVVWTYVFGGCCPPITVGLHVTLADVGGPVRCCATLGSGTWAATTLGGVAVCSCIMFWEMMW